jgi:hypothetical protein
MNYASPMTTASLRSAEQLRLEGVTACVGFDDLLDVTLAANHPHFDSMIVVTSHDDTKTQAVARKHGAILAVTDLFKKNGRTFNKGAGLNAGLSRFQYHCWRLHIDSDIILPDNFRRILFNHTALDTSCIYGADRIDVIGRDELAALKNAPPQAIYSFLMQPQVQRAVSHRYVDTLRGYVPIGYFQLWNAVTQKDYPYSLGSCQHDDVLFAEQWPAAQRRLLPSVITYHLCAQEPTIGENWDGTFGIIRAKAFTGANTVSPS